MASTNNHLSLAPTLRLTLLHLRTNGPEWMACYLLRSGAQKLSRALDVRLETLERTGAPGRNSVAANRLTWQNWDWTSAGEEWTESAEWKTALLEDVLDPHVCRGGTILEIGPGSGRWTTVLRERAERLILVDLSECCIELCRRRFADAANIEFFVNDGRTLPFVEDTSIDSIWSYDVFVHLSPAETSAYLAEFSRVLKPGGRAVIHHPTGGDTNGGWRSRVTAEHFSSLVHQAGMRVVGQVREFGPEGQFRPSVHEDTISILEGMGVPAWVS